MSEFPVVAYCQQVRQFGTGEPEEFIQVVAFNAETGDFVGCWTFLHTEFSSFIADDQQGQQYVHEALADQEHPVEVDIQDIKFYGAREVLQA